MGEAHNKGTLDRGAASDLWRRTLCQIPTTFGRLVYLSSLRNANNGAYEHHGLSLMFGEDEAGAALLRSHEDSFAEWLVSPLEQQKADLDLYLSGLTPNRRPVVETWLRLAPYRNLVPATARGSERDLFASDFHLLLEALRREYGLAAPDPENP
jgi:hypothetical protein